MVGELLIANLKLEVKQIFDLSLEYKWTKTVYPSSPLVGMPIFFCSQVWLGLYTNHRGYIGDISQGNEHNVTNFPNIRCKWWLNRTSRNNLLRVWSECQPLGTCMLETSLSFKLTHKPSHFCTIYIFLKDKRICMPIEKFGGGGDMMTWGGNEKYNKHSKFGIPLGIEGLTYFIKNLINFTCPTLLVVACG